MTPLVSVFGHIMFAALTALLVSAACLFCVHIWIAIWSAIKQWRR